MQGRFSLVPLCLWLSACSGGDPLAGKTAAVMSASSLDSVTQPTAHGVAFPFSQADSSVEFVGAKITHSHKGAFGTFHGSIDLVDGSVEKSSVFVEIAMDSISSDDPKLTTHLKSEDLLGVDKFPKATFASSAIEPGPTAGTYLVKGDMQLHGVTKTLQFPATIKASDSGVDVDAEFTFNRKEFGINYPGMPDDLIKDAVLVKFKLRAKKG